MKRCPQCQQTYSDDINFCLSDGTPLVSVVNAPDEATVIRSPVPPVQLQSQPVRQGVSPVFVYLAIGLLVLFVGAASLLWIRAGLNVQPAVNNENAYKISNLTDSKSNKDQDKLNEQKSNLQAQQEALEKEKQRLAEERNKLDAQKNNSPDTTFSQKSSLVYPTTRIKFRRGSFGETVSGSIGAERSFVLSTMSGQYLSANVNSPNGCVTFRNGSTSTSYTTGSGDSYLYLVNKCSGAASFSLTVSVR